MKDTEVTSRVMQCTGGIAESGSHRGLLVSDPEDHRLFFYFDDKGDMRVEINTCEYTILRSGIGVPVDILSTLYPVLIAPTPEGAIRLEHAFAHWYSRIKILVDE